MAEKLPEWDSALCVNCGCDHDPRCKCAEFCRRREIKPIPGMGATIQVGSDSYPATIVSVSENLGTLVVVRDDYKRADDGGPFTESQTYEYFSRSDPDGELFSLRKNGAYVEVGSSYKSGRRLYIGHRRAYRDPSF